MTAERGIYAASPCEDRDADIFWTFVPGRILSGINAALRRSSRHQPVTAWRKKQAQIGAFEFTLRVDGTSEKAADLDSPSMRRHFGSGVADSISSAGIRSVS